MKDEKVKKFLETMKSDPKAGELLKGYEAPADQAGEIRIYAGIASKLGYEITESDLETYLNNTADIMQKKTEEAAADILELPDDVLDRVAGGNKEHKSCQDTYENCWVNDGCDNIYHVYKDYVCHGANWKDPCHETAKPCDNDAYCTQLYRYE